VYRLLVSAIVPRPIAFVSTISPNGVTNLAPFSYFMGVSSSPPCLAISVARKADGTKKDTLLNIESTGEFVVNSSQASFSDQVNAAATGFPYGVSEFTEIGLHSMPSVWVRPPRVEESAIHMECKTEKIVELGGDEPGAVSLVIGRVIGIHVDQSVMTDDTIDYAKLDPLARLGGTEWLRGGEVFRLVRPR